jgi:uncharacterized protein YpmS
MSSKLVIVLATLALAAQIVCCGAILGSPPSPSTVTPPEETLDQSPEPTQHVDTSDKGTPIITVTEEEMTALAAQMLEDMEDAPPISQPQVLFRDGRVELYGTIHVTDSNAVPGKAVLSLDVQNGDITVTVEEMSLGPLPVPPSFVETVNANINQALDEWAVSDATGYVITDIEIGYKKAVVYGRPSDG